MYTLLKNIYLIRFTGRLLMRRKSNCDFSCLLSYALKKRYYACFSGKKSNVMLVNQHTLLNPVKGLRELLPQHFTTKL